MERRECKGTSRRGGYEVDIAWANGALLKAVIVTTKSQTCEVFAKQKVRIEKEGEEVRWWPSSGNGCICFLAESGKVYVLTIV